MKFYSLILGDERALVLANDPFEALEIAMLLLGGKWKLAQVIEQTLSGTPGLIFHGKKT